MKVGWGSINTLNNFQRSGYKNELEKANVRLG
jgi:hypothetical protein